MLCFQELITLISVSVFVNPFEEVDEKVSFQCWVKRSDYRVAEELLRGNIYILSLYFAII